MEQVLDTWRAPDGKCYRVSTQDGQAFELCYSEINDAWSIVEDARQHRTINKRIQGEKMNKSYLAHRVASLKPSGIRKFFDIVATMKDVISLGIGEPDFDTPEPILQAGHSSLSAGRPITHRTPGC